MRKTNAALLEEIEQMENEVLEARRERDEANKILERAGAVNRRNEEEIKWLKRIIEGLVKAPSVVTR